MNAAGPPPGARPSPVAWHGAVRPGTGTAPAWQPAASTGRVGCVSVGSVVGGVAWRSIGAALLASAGAGVGGALFLWGLDAVTGWHRGHPWFLALLPAMGVAGAWLYRQAPHGVGRGTAWVVERSRGPADPVPFVMAPLIVLTTLLTHLGGGSAGREGTALQWGGGVASGVMTWLRLPAAAASWMLPAGMASGFAAVFGTPWAAAVFALEVVHGHRGWLEGGAGAGVGRVRGMVACVAMAWVGHAVAMACGARHVALEVAAPVGLPGPGLLVASAVGGLAMGGLARVFLVGMERARAVVGRLPRWWMPPVAGGVLVGWVAWATGERGYLGLGVEPMDPGDPSIAGCLRGDAIPAWAWAGKLAFTVATLASGFRGGEVTPLFFVGAAAGHALGTAAGLPPGMMAAAGLTSLFAAASRAPVACVVMGWELFGWGVLPCVVVACVAGHGAGPGVGLYPVAGSGAVRGRPAWGIKA